MHVHQKVALFIGDEMNHRFLFQTAAFEKLAAFSFFEMKDGWNTWCLCR
jgi:hypothetical protein